MPARSRPRASFEPIAPELDLKALVEATPNFSYVDRISYEMIEQQGMDAFEKLVTLHVIVGGKPLIIDGFEERLDGWTYTPKWLRDNCGDKVENARNLTAKENLPLTMGHYLKNMGLLTNQFFDKPFAYKDKKRQRVYLKDIDCPPVWWDKLKDHIPQTLTYLNDSTGDAGGPGAKPDLHSTQPGRRLGKGIARAGDLMSSLPPDMRAENLMCYIGHEGTYTPAHKEMCASLGHNIMVEASHTVSDDGKAEKPGSSIWFMTESKDRHLVSEYFLSVLGHDIEVENHFAQIPAWKKAPFNVYVVEQRPGDFILIPPLAPHQVWNRGTRTMKVAWNRTTVETLEMAINEALPRARIVCREEQYKNKAIIYYTLQKYASLLMDAQRQAATMPREAALQFLYTGKLKQLIRDFKRLFNLYKTIMLTEMFNPTDTPKNLEYLPFDSNVTCAYCRGNVFNRFLTCPNCKDLLGHGADEDGDPYDVCMDCYAMGRSCACLSGLKWAEQFKWKELLSKYDAWRKLIIELDGNQVTAKTPEPLLAEHQKYGKKTLAEVCREQLKRRPFKDVKKPNEPKEDEDTEEEIVVGDDGTVKKITKKKSKAWLKANKVCHVCCTRHPFWKMAQCTTCERGWCYGSLFRGWDKMPLEIMENPDWSCPHCLGVCFAGACRREGISTPYEPKGTLLGHDTKKVADVRSVECLVDFSVSNLTWLKDDDPENRAESRRLDRARAEADAEKANEPRIEDDDEAEVANETQLAMEYSDGETTLDPALGGQAIPSGNRRRQQPGEYLMSGALPGETEEEALARRLQEANATLPGPAAMTAGAPAHGELIDGHAPLATGGYEGYAPQAQMYPDPSADAYQYPGQNTEPGEEELRPFTKRRQGEEDDDEDIAMTKGRKQKKPRLATAGFRSYDLAEEAVGPQASKAKNEAQRDFEREKERKALEKAKSEGRFIILQAAIKGKKRIVKLNIPGARLAQFMAQQLATAALAGAVHDPDADAEHEDEDGNIAQSEVEQRMDGLLLTSDIAPKKQLKDQYEQRVKDGRVLTGNTKKALVPVEKDESYNGGGHLKNKRTRPEESGVQRRQGRKSHVPHDYEEIDIGSEASDDGLDENESSFVPINGSSARNRRSLPSYLKKRHGDDDEDFDGPTELPDDHRDRSHKGPNTTRVRHPKQVQVSQDGPDAQLIQETEAAFATNSAGRPSFSGKGPAMRPVSGGAEHAIDIDSGDDSSVGEAIEAVANGHFGDSAPLTGSHNMNGDNTAASSSSKAAQLAAQAEEAAAAKAQALKEQAARAQAVKDQAAKAKAAKEQAVKDQAARAQAVKDQAAKAQAAKIQAARQKQIDDENRNAKLQMLGMFDNNDNDDDMFGSVRAGSAKKPIIRGGPANRRIIKGGMKIMPVADEAESDDDDDDGIDEVPARKRVKA